MSCLPYSGILKSASQDNTFNYLINLECLQVICKIYYRLYTPITQRSELLTKITSNDFSFEYNNTN